MLTVALVCSSVTASEAITQVMEDSGMFRVVYKTTKIPEPHQVIRAVHSNDPDLLLIDVRVWDSVSPVVTEMAGRGARTVTVGYRPDWTPDEETTSREERCVEPLREPFSPRDLEESAYAALHRRQGIQNRNIIAFLPAKAGSGSSTVALHTAAALAGEYKRKTLVLECDRRSGVLSILLNLNSLRGFAGAMEDMDQMTDLSWRNYHEKAFGLDLLLATPERRGPLPTWGDYYKLLRFAQDRYDFLVADLPEVVNSASAEVVRHARNVVVVCTPELPSVKMAAYRCRELEECEVAPERIHLVLNRYERGGVNVKDAEIALGRPVLATLPNDYGRLRHAMVESRLAPPECAFGRGCRALAEKLTGAPEGVQADSRFSLFKKLGSLME